jgi:type VI secretion system protein ImpG
MSMNYLTLEDKDALAGALKLYDWTPGYVNWRRLQGMRTLSSRSGCTVVEGIPLRGRDLDLDMDPTYFANAGDAYLFGEVLSHFLALYAHLNSYTRLTCRWTSGERFRWPAMNGRQQPV